MKFVKFFVCAHAPVRLAASTLALLAAVPVLAQSPSTATLHQVVVTASRLPQPISEVVADVSVIGPDEIARAGAATATELLGRLPGLQTISFGDSSRVYIRGADARMTALYVDGVRVDSQDGLMLGGGVPWALVPLGQIDRIEVLRGPASAIYGSDAMGGVIQIFTRRGESVMTPYVNLGLGSAGLQKVDAGLSGAHNGWDYALGLSLQNSDGFDTRPDLVHTPDHEASARKAASLRWGVQLAPAQRLELTALNSQLESQYVPWGGGNNTHATGDLTTAAVKWSAQWTPAYSTQLTLSRSQIAKQDDAPNDYQTTLNGVLLENHFRMAGGVISAVLEQKKDDFNAKPTTWDPAFQGERSQTALALGYAGTWGSHSVQLNAREDRDSLFGTHQTGAVAYAYALTPLLRASLSTGTAFRAPTLEQIFGPYGSVQLSPETNRSHEISLTYAQAERSLKAVVYRNAVSNMISSNATLATCSAGFFCYYNVGQARMQGATLSGAYDFRHYALRAALDWLDPIDEVTGRVLSLRARKTLTLGVDRSASGWQWGTELQAVGERFDNAANSIVLPGYALLNVSAGTQLKPDWRLSLRLDNAADVQYQQVGQYASAGRTWYVGLQWQPK
jgi:vitamin B12 transporter